MEKLYCDAVDPVFLGALQFLRKIDAGQIVPLADVRTALKQLIEQGERMIGPKPEWKLIKYALCCWVDEIFSNSNWPDKGLWKEKPLEKEFFGDRIAFHEFFEKASEAAAASHTNALEVYYLCVVLGFRGVYRGADQPQRIQELERLNLPKDPAEWCRETARSLKARHSLPPFSETVRPLRTNEAQQGKQQLLLSAILTALLVASALGGWYFALQKFNSSSKQEEKVTRQSTFEVPGFS
jgi:type VI secretion system protein ImpK